MESEKVAAATRLSSSKFVQLLFIILLCAANLSACGDESGQAEDPTQLIVYSSIPKDLVGGYLADFETKNPDIDVRLVNQVTLALTNKLLEEVKEPQADVIWGLAVTSMYLVEWQYLLTLYAPEGIERVAPLFRDDTVPPYWVGVSVRSLVFCTNPDVLQTKGLTPPKSWADLAKPAYQGQLVMPTPSRTSVGYLLISAILQLYGEIEGWEYLEQLDQNTGQYVRSVVDVCPLVAAGDYPIGISYDYRAVQQKLSKDPVNIIYPEEKSGWEAEVNALVRKDTVKPAAKRFLDWAIGDDAMHKYAQDRAIITVDLDRTVPEGFPRDPKTHLLDQDIPWIAANRMRIQKEWFDLFGDAEN